MPLTSARPGVPDPPETEAGLTSTYALVIAVEAIVIAVLYLLGRYFG